MRWIESVQPLVTLPANPSEWTPADSESVRELLNGDAVRGLLEAWLEYEAQRQAEQEQCDASPGPAGREVSAGRICRRMQSGSGVAAGAVRAADGPLLELGEERWSP